jgi:cytidylate kinase
MSRPDRRHDADEPFVIALDGPAASGKSTVGAGVARRLGLLYFDTGLLYRAATWLAIERGVPPTAAEALEAMVRQVELRVEPSEDGQPRVLADGRDVTACLNRPEVDATISLVSAHPGVREALRAAQRGVVRRPGVVMAGRDIGTVIVPEAPLKVWLSASPEERARRRADQTGEAYTAVLERMRRRDRLDGSRAVAPMVPATDAVELATDGVPPERVIERIVELARQRMRRG